MSGVPATPVGLIGLGAMGHPMAENLLAAGTDLVVHARRPEIATALAEGGARLAATPAALAAEVSVLFLVLRDAPDTEDVLFGRGEAAAALRPGALVVDCSTCAPPAAEALAERLAALGIDYLDAPVSGGVGGAVAGTLSIMVGGAAGALERARPHLEVVGGTITHLGPVGAGEVAKACNQLVVAGTIELVAEALLLAERSGVDPGLVREALLGGLAFSRVLENHGGRMLTEDYVPGFRNRLQAKDTRIVAAQAARVGLPLPAFAGAASQVEVAAAHPEWSELDHAALHRVLGAAPSAAAGDEAVVR